MNCKGASSFSGGCIRIIWLIIPTTVSESKGKVAIRKGGMKGKPGSAKSGRRADAQKRHEAPHWRGRGWAGHLIAKHGDPIKSVYEVDPLMCPTCGGRTPPSGISFYQKTQRTIREKILRAILERWKRLCCCRRAGCLPMAPPSWTSSDLSDFCYGVLSVIVDNFFGRTYPFFSTILAIRILPWF